MTGPDDARGPGEVDALSSRCGGLGWWAAVSAVAAFALVLRLPGTLFDLPYTHHPDETLFVGRAFQMLSEDSFHPHWFGHPGTPQFYLLMGTYALIYLAMVALGRIGSFAELEALFYRDPTAFYLSARLWSVLFGVACVVALAEIGRRHFGRAVGLVAAITLAAQPMTVSYSKMARIDTLLPLLSLVGVGFALAALEEGRPRHFLLVGATTGVAMMTKFPGAVLGLLVPLALLLRRELLTRRGVRIALGSLVAFLVLAFVTSPYFFLDGARVAADLRAEFRSNHPGANGGDFVANVIWYLGRLTNANHGFGILGAALAAAGILARQGRRSRTERGKVLLVIGFVALVILTNAVGTLRWARWMIPALPFVALMIGLGVEELRRLVVRWRRPRLATAIAVLALAGTVAQPIRLDIAWGRAMSLPRTQTLLAEWILQNVPPGSSILIERQGVQLPAGRYELYEVDGGSGHLVRIDPATRPHERIEGRNDYSTLEDLSELDREGIDFFVTSGGVQGPFRWEPGRYGDEIRRYDALLAAGELVHEVRRTAGEAGGPKIGLYAWKGAVARSDGGVAAPESTPP